MSELTKREDVNGLEGYYTYETNGKFFSVVNLGVTMKGFPHLEQMKEAGIFLGWEAMQLVEGMLEGDTIRAYSWEQLKSILDSENI